MVPKLKTEKEKPQKTGNENVDQNAGNHSKRQNVAYGLPSCPICYMWFPLFRMYVTFFHRHPHSLAC